VSTFSNRWKKLGRKKYREEFAAAQVKQSIPLQIRKLLKQHGMSQETLAEKAGLTQGVVSRAANPDYGNLTLNTLIRIAAGFDIAFIGKFVPFTELDRWFADLSEESLRVKTYPEENKEIEERAKEEPKAAIALSQYLGAALSDWEEACSLSQQSWRIVNQSAQYGNYGPPEPERESEPPLSGQAIINTVNNVLKMVPSGSTPKPPSNETQIQPSWGTQNPSGDFSEQTLKICSVAA
jgi:transcriptional regulator with XRE-family HTH domain